MAYQRESRKRPIDQATTINSQKRPENGPKRQKRGKYVSKACDECQRRKIKCDGNLPCEPCLLHERDCERETLDMRRRAARSQEIDKHNDMPTPQRNICQKDDWSSTRELCSRVTHLEELMHIVVPKFIPDLRRTENISSSANSHEPGSPQCTSGEHNVARTSPRNERQRNHPLSAFSGESSIQARLYEVERGLKSFLNVYQTQDFSSTQPSSPALTGLSLELDDVCPGQAFHPNEILRKYGIDPKREQWDASLKVFCNEVYIMYPFLHLHSLWDDYTGLWNGWLSVPYNPTLNVKVEQDKRPLVTQVLICLAIGQCTASPRIASEDGRYSAGWSLYRAALDFLGDVFASFEDYENQLLILQIFALMVIYLFRLDMNGKAEKFLAIAISHAHYLGIHKIETATNAINSYSKEMSRRLWWSLYVLDRRLAIESGRPFLIQDLSTSKPLPQSLPGDLQCYRGVNSPTVTPIDFLAATVTYSTVLGKVWEVINGAPSTDATSTFFLKDYFEGIISRAQRNVPIQFSGNLDDRSSETETTERPWWLVKQQALMRMRWQYIRLLIRRPMSGPAFSAISDFENDAICMDAASKVITEFFLIPKKQAVFTFPFFHYIISSVILSLGLIVREPSFKETYGNMTRRSVHLLMLYCRKTWVSGKLIRTVSRLSAMITRVLESTSSISTQSSDCTQGAGLDQSNYSGVKSHGSEFLDPLSFHQSIEWADLMMSDFEFEQTHMRRPVHARLAQKSEANGLHLPHESQGSSDLGNCGMPCLFLTETSQRFGSDETGLETQNESVCGQMEWLNALVGNYLDPSLVPPANR